MYTSQLVVLGQCRQVEIVKAFGASSISVKRHVKKYREGGAGIFFKERSVRKFTVLTPEVLARAQELLNEGKSRYEVSEELCIKSDTLYRAIRSGRLVEFKKK
jgi:transposase